MSELDAALGAAAAEKDREEWLARRATGFGSSDMGALWIALGWVTGEKLKTTPKYMLKNAERLFREKAGLLKPLKRGRAAQLGVERERLLWESCRWSKVPGAIYAPDHQEALGTLDIADPEEPRHRTTREAWVTGEPGTGILAVVELKCTRERKASLPWYWALQVQSEATALGAAEGYCVIGQGWALDDIPTFPDIDDSGVEEFHVTLTDEHRMMIRRSVRMGWAEVEKLKEGR